MVILGSPRMLHAHSGALRAVFGENSNPRPRLTLLILPKA